jgi:hypothetical protein
MKTRANSFFRLAEEMRQQFRKQQHHLANFNILEDWCFKTVGI